MSHSARMLPGMAHHACWHCDAYAGLTAQGTAGLCSRVGARRVRSAPQNGCSAWVREPGATRHLALADVACVLLESRAATLDQTGIGGWAILVFSKMRLANGVTYPVVLAAARARLAVKFSRHCSMNPSAVSASTNPSSAKSGAQKSLAMVIAHSVKASAKSFAFAAS